MENDPFLHSLKKARISHNPNFKARLKEQLLERAEKTFAHSPRREASIWSTLFRYSVAFAALAIVVTQVLFPSPSGPSSLAGFIQQAKAAQEGTENQIYHATIVMEKSALFENIGWKTLSKMEKEVWISPTGNRKEHMISTNFNGPNESGSFEAVQMEDTTLVKINEWGNLIPYTKRVQTGTEIVEREGEAPLEQPTYNVHPEKQYSDEALQKKFSQEIACINTQENEDFTGYGIVRLDSETGEFEGLTARTLPKDPKYTLIDQIGKAAEGQLASDEIIALFEAVAQDPNILYEFNEDNPSKEHKIQLNYADFSIVSSNSKEGLENAIPQESVATFYFDDATYQLTEMNSETSQEGVITERGTLKVTSSEYLPMEGNEALFEPTEEYVAGGLQDRFETQLETFDAGCYNSQYEKLSPEETTEWIASIEANLEDHERTFWFNPLETNLGYYRLPGEAEIKGSSNETNLETSEESAID